VAEVGAELGGAQGAVTTLHRDCRDRVDGVVLDGERDQVCRKGGIEGGALGRVERCRQVATQDPGGALLACLAHLAHQGGQLVGGHVLRRRARGLGVDVALERGTCRCCALRLACPLECGRVGVAERAKGVTLGALDLGACGRCCSLGGLLRGLLCFALLADHVPRILAIVDLPLVEPRLLARCLDCPCVGTADGDLDLLAVERALEDERLRARRTRPHREARHVLVPEKTFLLRLEGSDAGQGEARGGACLEPLGERVGERRRGTNRADADRRMSMSSESREYA